MKRLALLVLVLLISSPVRAQEDRQRVLASPLVRKLDRLKWERLVPELGARSPNIARLRTDPRTQATQVLIRFNERFHIPLHWHTVNESQIIVKGHVTVELNGVRSELERGDFNYIPAKMPHESWTGKEGALIYIHSDGAWDFNWVEHEPGPADFFERPAKVEK